MDKQKMIDMYLDWVNNFLTLNAFAIYYDLTPSDAQQVINEGRVLHEANCKGSSHVL